MLLGVAVVHGLVNVHVFVLGLWALGKLAILHSGASLAVAIVLETRARDVILASVLALVKTELAARGQVHTSGRASFSETCLCRAATLLLETEQFGGVLGPLRLLEVHISAL